METPEKDLMKSSVDVEIDGTKLCVKSSFYTTNIMLQGENS